MRRESPQIEGEAAESEPSLETQEVMVEARAERRRLMTRLFRSRCADLTGNLVPGVDMVKMTSEAIAGTTSSGAELSARDRFDYALIAGGTALAYALGLAELPTTALATRGITAFVAGVEFGPRFLEETAHAAEGRHPRLAHLLRTVAEFTADKRAAIGEVGERLRDSLAGLKPSAR